MASTQDTGMPLHCRCMRCGVLLPEDAQFCDRCGANLPPRPRTELLGFVIGARFEVSELIGSGGMGAVYRGLDLIRNRPVAIKAMLREHVFSPLLRLRFSREAQSLFNVSHPNVVQFLAYFEAVERGPILIMEFLQGDNADELLERQGRLPVSQAVSIACDALKGLYHLHSLPDPVVHRDIKPSNLRVLGDGSTKLIDLGIARNIVEKGITRAGSVLGTPEYMSPEQIRAMSDLGPASDQYSLGATLFELLCGRTPFLRTTEKGNEVKKAHLFDAPPDPRGIRPELPEGLSQVVLRALAKEPEGRFPDCFEMLKALEPYGEFAGNS